MLRTNGDCPLFRADWRSPLLATQIVLPVVGMIVVLALPVVSLAEQPAHLPDWLAGLGRRARLARAVAERRGRRLVSWPGLAGKLMHVVAGLAAGVGVLIACHVGRNQSAAAAWLAYHTLTTAWAAAAFAVLAIGWLERRCAACGWRWPFLRLAPTESRRAIAG